MAQTCLYGCFHCCSTLVPPLPAQNMPYELICVAKMLFLAYFCPFLALVGPHLGHSGSGKWANLNNLDVLCAVPTLFHPVSLNKGSHMTIILKMPILDLFGAFLGPFEGLNIWLMCCQSHQRSSVTKTSRLGIPAHWITWFLTLYQEKSGREKNFPCIVY